MTLQLPAANQSAAHVYSSTTGLTFTPVTTGDAPCYTGYPSGGLMHHPVSGWLNFQVVPQNLSANGSATKTYADELGPKARRVISVLSSVDGAKWTPLAPPPPATPSGPVLLTPNVSIGDPPDLVTHQRLPLYTRIPPPLPVRYTLYIYGVSYREGCVYI